MNESSLEKICSARELFALYGRIGGVIMEFCTAYCAALKVRPEIKAEMIELGISAQTLRRAEKFGNGTLDARIVLASGRQYLKLENCPVSEQKDALENGIEIWDPAINDSRRICLNELTTRQIDQGIAIDHIRTVSEQRSYHSEQALKTVTEEVKPKYQATKKELIIFDQTGRISHRFPRMTVKQICKEMAL